MPKDDRNQERKQQIRELDGILPESLNRRAFFKATGVTLVGGMFAGCSSDGGGSTATEASTGNTASESSSGTTSGGGEDIMAKRNITWRQPWKTEPGYAPAYIADISGYWLDAGVSPPTVLEGYGSPDTARRIGTGQEQMGHASISSVIPGFAEDYELTFVGLAKQRSFLGIVYRTDSVDDPKALEGKRVGLDSGLGQSTWPLWVNLNGMDDSQIDTQGGEGEVLFNQMAQGNLDALWTSLDEIPAIRATMPEGVEVGHHALYSELQVPGYPIFVNTTWYQETPDGVEYMSRVLEGYSHALKWWMLNPEEMIDLMLEQINPSLQTTGREELLDLQRFNLANTVSEQAFEEGLGFISEEIVDNSLNELGPNLVDDESVIPDVENVLDLEPLDNADLATLTADEQEQVIEFAGDAWALYE